jgi:hypothetical protein
VQVAAQGAFQGYEKQAGGLMAAWGKDFIGEATVNVLQQVATNATNGFIDANSLEIEDGQVVGWRFDGISGLRASLERTLWPAMWLFARAGANELLKGTAVGCWVKGRTTTHPLSRQPVPWLEKESVVSSTESLALTSSISPISSILLSKIKNS